MEFRDLRARIDLDVDGLTVQGFQVFRPAVFFLSNGRPRADDDWRQSLPEPKGPRMEISPQHPGIRDRRRRLGNHQGDCLQAGVQSGRDECFRG